MAALVVFASAFAATATAGVASASTPGSTLSGPIQIYGNATDCVGLATDLQTAHITPLSTLATDTSFPTSPDNQSHSNSYIDGTVSSDTLTITSQPGVIVDYVVVKGGADKSNDNTPGYNVYTGPAENLDGSQVFVAAPFNGFSHWFVCYHMGQATPTVSTALTGGSVSGGVSTLSVPLGGSFTDVATVSGGSSPSGTVTFSLYSNNTCSTQVGSSVFSSTWTGDTVTSPSMGPINSTGTYYVKAVYGGDTNNAGNTSPCTSEVVTVGQATPTVSTTANGGLSSATDTVTVRGPSGQPTPTGTVVFTLYSSNGTSEGTNTQTLSGGTATSTPFSYTGLAAGTYHFVAVYTPDTAGGAYYTSGSDGGSATVSSDGEFFSVTTPPPPPPPGTPPTATLSTTPSVNGLTASDFATVIGNSGTPTGTVTFTLYSGQPGSGTLVSGYVADQENLVNGSATSVPSGTLPAGNYYFMVTYSGGGVYSPITPGTAEAFSIAFLTPVLGTTPTVTGLSATDSATVSGTSGTPTGTVTFTLFSGAPGSGKQVGSYTPDTVTLVSGTASSAPTPTLPSGNYYFMVTYSGDGTYSAITPGTAEAFTIIAVSPAPAPKKHKKPVVPPYKIPTKPPTTGFGGSARTVYNGGLLVGGSSVLVFGLLMMAYALRRRRRS